MEIRKTLASNIKILMHQAGIQSQTQLARITGVSQSQIGNILRSDKGVSINVLERLAQGLECEPWLLLAPISFLENYDNKEFGPMMCWHMRHNKNGSSPDRVGSLA